MISIQMTQQGDGMDAQRYTVTVTHELVAGDGSRSSARTRTATIWAESPEMAKTKVERWAQREFHQSGFIVIAHATEVRLAD
jgi:hypothetical protein